MKGKSNNGMTIIETLIVFSIGLVFLALSISVYKSARDKLYIYKESQNILYMITKVEEVSRWDGNEGGDMLSKFLFSVADANLMGIIPDGMVFDSKGNGGKGRLVNLWGGDVWISTAAEISGNARTVPLIFTVNYLVPASVCVNFVMGQRNNNWRSIAINHSSNFHSKTKNIINPISTRCNKLDKRYKGFALISFGKPI